MANENLKKVLHELCEFTPSNYDIDDILKAVKLDKLEMQVKSVEQANKQLETMQTLLEDLKLQIKKSIKP